MALISFVSSFRESDIVVEDRNGSYSISPQEELKGYVEFADSTPLPAVRFAIGLATDRSDRHFNGKNYEDIIDFIERNPNFFEAFDDNNRKVSSNFKDLNAEVFVGQ